MAIVRVKGLQVEVCEVLKRADPTAHISICSGDGRNTTDGETARVVSGRAGRIRKRLLPQLDVGFQSVEFERSEQVDSRPLDPRLGDDAARLERNRFVV